MTVPALVSMLGAVVTAKLKSTLMLSSNACVSPLVGAMLGNTVQPSELRALNAPSMALPG